MKEFEIVEKKLAYHFKDASLLKLALTHPSVAHERKAPGFQHNQRLEFLGDAVLQLVLTQELFERNPDLSEGPLTKARAQLVNRQTLAEVSRNLKIGSHLILSQGEETSGGRDRTSALADAFEALLGAVYLDGGLEASREFVLHHFEKIITGMTNLPDLNNPKGELQEFLQAESQETPTYHLASISGPDHDRSFICTVHAFGKEIGKGTGKSKKTAEIQAALTALNHLKNSGDIST